MKYFWVAELLKYLKPWTPPYSVLTGISYKTAEDWEAKSPNVRRHDFTMGAFILAQLYTSE